MNIKRRDFGKVNCPKHGTGLMWGYLLDGRYGGICSLCAQDPERIIKIKKDIRKAHAKTDL